MQQRGERSSYRKDEVEKGKFTVRKTLKRKCNSKLLSAFSLLCPVSESPELSTDSFQLPQILF
jgi:hypothetical protein